MAFDAKRRLYVRDLVRVTRFVWDPQRRLVAKYDTAERVGCHFTLLYD